MNPTDTRWKAASGVSSSRAHAEAVKLLRGIKPTTRLTVFKDIADDIHKHPMLVEFFRQRMYDPALSRQGILSHPEDAFGDAFWAWKGWHGIDEDDSKWDGMSTDENFRKLLEKAVKAAIASGPADISGEDTRDYFSISLKVKTLADTVQKLDRSIPTEENRLKALALVEEIGRLLK